MFPALFLIAGVVMLPVIAYWEWRLQKRLIGALLPGAEFEDVAALADLPLITSLARPPKVAPGPQVQLLALIREATSLFVAYRPVAEAAAQVTTQVLDLATAGNRELAVLARWHSVHTPVVVWTDPVAGQVAIQEPRSLLTVTLPVRA